MPVERRKYVLGFLNASNSRGFNLALSSGEPFMFICQDAGLGPAPVEVESFRIGPGERYGLVVDFEKHRIGDRIVLQNRELKNNEDFPSTRQVMRFDVVSDATTLANNVVPDILVPARRDPDHPHDPMPLRESEAVRTRDFRFERSNGLWTVNGVDLGERPHARPPGARRRRDLAVHQQLRRLEPPHPRPSGRLQDPGQERSASRSPTRSAARTRCTSGRARPFGSSRSSVPSRAST